MMPLPHSCPCLSSQADCKSLTSLASLSPPESPPPPSAPPALSILPTITPSSSINQTVYLGYGKPAPFSLGPCATINSGNSSSTPTCAASAYDALDGDISYAINPVDITSSPGHVQCSSSSMTQMTMGRCLPGQYLIRYSVTNSLGLTSSAFLTLFIEELNVVTLDYSFVLSNRSDDLTYVSSYASQLKESNSSLASCLAAHHLPSFGIALASLRSLSVNQTSVGSLTDVGNSTAGYPISIKLTAVTVSRSYLYLITPPSDPCNFYQMQGTIPQVTLPQSVLDAMISRRRSLQAQGIFEDRLFSLARSLLSTSSNSSSSSPPSACGLNSSIFAMLPPVRQQLTPSVSPGTVLLALILASTSNLSLSSNSLSLAESSYGQSLDSLMEALQAKDDLYRSSLSSFFSSEDKASVAELAALDQASQATAQSLNATTQSLVDLLDAATKLVYQQSQASMSQSLDLSSELILETYGINSMR